MTERDDLNGIGDQRSGPATAVNPLVKLTMLIIFAILVLFISSVPYILMVLAFLVAMVIIFRTGMVFRRGIFTFALMIFLAQILLVRSGEVLFRYHLITITATGLKGGILITGKFLSIIIMSWLFVSTTKPSELSAGMTAAGIPYRYSFMLVLAMRFVNVFRLELSTVREAQAVRGLRVGKRLRGLLRSIRYTTVPLLFSALGRVNSLSASMEGRGFASGDTRTYLHPVPFTASDLAVGVLSVIIAFELYFADRMVIFW